MDISGQSLNVHLFILLGRWKTQRILKDGEKLPTDKDREKWARQKRNQRARANQDDSKEEYSILDVRSMSQ